MVAKAPVRVKVLVGKLEEAAMILRQNGCTVSLVNAASLFPSVKLEQRHPHGLVGRKTGCSEGVQEHAAAALETDIQHA